MDTKFPSISKCSDHLRFLREILIFAVLYIAPVYEWLEVGAIANTVRRIEINHLNLASHAFLF